MDSLRLCARSTLLLANALRRTATCRSTSRFISTAFRPPRYINHRRSLATIADSNIPQPWRKHGDVSPGLPVTYSFFEPVTDTWQYVVTDPSTRDAVLIDTVLDYDPASGTLSTSTADGILAFVRNHALNVTKILETHAHADHLTASQYLKHHLSGNVPVCIGERIAQVQKHFAPVYGLAPQNLATSFDIFLKDDQVFMLGNLPVQVMHLPGHTPDHIGYLVRKSVFTGDSIFMPDLGSARADFPGGDARALYRSLQKLLSLPSDYEIFVGHDYPNGREKNCATTVAEQRQHNKHVKVGTTERDFVDFRTARDKVLKAPRLIHPSLQVNVRAGRLPPPDPTTGLSYFRTPLCGALDI